MAASVAAGLLASLMVTAPASAAVAAAPAGVDRVVSVSGSIDASCGSGLAPATPVHTTIAAAVAAATPGQQIYVCAGTYAENVDVNKNDIDLLGPNWNDPTQGSDPAVIAAPSSASPAVAFTGTTNTDSGLRGFTVTGGTHGVRVAASDGCCWDGATEGIVNNTFDGQTVAAIQTDGLNGPGRIEGNVVAPAAGADGIVVLDSIGGLQVTSNTITLTGASGTGVRVGLESIPGGGLLSVGVNVASNTVDGGEIGIHVYGRPNETGLEQWAETIAVSQNDLSGQAANGVRLSGSTLNVDILDNTIASPGGSGIWLRGPSTVSGHDLENTEVYRNTITNAGRDGIEVTGHVWIVRAGGTAANGNTITDPARHGIAATGFLRPGSSTAVALRDFAMDDVWMHGNTIDGAGCDGLHVENVDVAPAYYNTITDAGCNGAYAEDVDWIEFSFSTITGSAEDGVHLSNVFDGYVWDDVITANTGDGVEMTDGTGSIWVSLNEVNDNGAGIRVTSPTVSEFSLINANDVSRNIGYACEDQSSGAFINLPATGTQGNDWTTDNVGASLQSPNGICGETLTAEGPLADGVVGDAYSETMTASGAPGPYTWYATLLPAGLTLDPSTGEVSGTPTTPVTDFPVTFWVASAGGMWGQFTDTITISPELTVDGILGDATLGQPYTSEAPTVNGGVGPYTWSATGLPDGLTIDPDTGVVSGTPTVAVADVEVTLTVTDADGRTATLTTTMSVLPEAPGIPIAHPWALGMVGAAGLAVLGLGRRRATVTR